jgi:uncharacterized protein YbbC (DUF1343 family)
MLFAMRAAARRGLGFVVLDRPNPIGGLVIEGPTVESGHASFVGAYPLPIRHGMTVGELARMFRDEENLDLDLEVVPCLGWRRSMLWTETGLPWVLPSPNMPTPDTALVYPGGCLIEGTNLSEGRGTTTPFEICGAPWLEPDALAAAMRELGADPAIALRPLRFEPTFHKFAGSSCGAVFLHPLDPAQARSYRTTLALLAAARRLAPDAFGWRAPPYEYEPDKMPIDILTGSAATREAIDAGATAADLDALAAVDAAAWTASTAAARLYD